MSEQSSQPQSNGYEYDCESYAGSDEASIDKMFPGWRDYSGNAPDASKQSETQQSA